MSSPYAVTLDLWRLFDRALHHLQIGNVAAIFLLRGAIMRLVNRKTGRETRTCKWKRPSNILETLWYELYFKCISSNMSIAYYLLTFLVA